jgi:WD40 repeat protein
VAFSPDGKTLAAGFGGFRGGVVLFDTAGGQRRTAEPLAGKQGETLADKEGSVNSVTFSPDGKTVAAGFGGYVEGGSGVVLFDAVSGQRRTAERLAVDEGYVSSVAFSPDGKTVAAGFDNSDRGASSMLPDHVGGVVLLTVTPESWERLAGQIANRNFTRDEWRRYFPDEPYRPTFPDLPVPPEPPSQ